MRARALSSLGFFISMAAGITGALASADAILDGQGWLAGAMGWNAALACITACLLLDYAVREE